MSSEKTEVSERAPEMSENSRFCNELGRIEGKLDDQGMRLDEISSQLRRLPCNTHEFRLTLLDGGSAGRPVKPPSGNHIAITKRDLENSIHDSQEVLLTRAEETAEDAARKMFDERLKAVEDKQTKRREETRSAIRGWLQIGQLALAIMAGAGVTLAARCEPRAAQMQRIQQVKPAPASAADARR